MTSKEKEARLKKRLGLHQKATTKARVDMLQYGLMVEVVNTIQAKLAQDAGFTAICPYDYSASPSAMVNSNPNTSDPRVIREMMNKVLIPLMAKVRIGHIIEAKMAEHLGANIIDESEYAEETRAKHVSKNGFRTPFMCGVSTLEQCFQRIEEGATMLRSIEVPNQNFSHTLSTIRTIFKTLKDMKTDDAAKDRFLENFTKNETLATINKAIDEGKLPVPFYGCGWVCTPNDVAMLRKLECGAIISNIAFRSYNPLKRLRYFVLASSCYKDPAKMVGLSIGSNEYVPEGGNIAAGPRPMAGRPRPVAGGPRNQ
ncbi:Pyridoxal 5'-phosphate synthase subunit snz1 [Coemansia sp. RSA 2050]|nr:Pyridoxal 5'-phosphate synthase subunit snz1 [Coemansia sp. RSA 2050]